MNCENIHFHSRKETFTVVGLTIISNYFAILLTVQGDFLSPLPLSASKDIRSFIPEMPAIQNIQHYKSHERSSL